MQVYGQWVRKGSYNLYFKALKKVIIQKRTLFILIFAENFTLLSRNIVKLIPFGASNSKHKKSAFSLWLYKGDNDVLHGIT